MTLEELKKIVSQANEKNTKIILWHDWTGEEHTTFMIQIHNGLSMRLTPNLTYAIKSQ